MSFLKRVLPVLGALVLVFFLGRAVYYALASDETLIRTLVQDEAEAFNGASVFGCMDGFAMDYEHATEGLDRARLQQMLLYIFNSRRDPETKEFLYSVEVPDERVEVTMSEDSGLTAGVVFPVVLSERGQPVWEIRVTAELTKEDGDWLFASSSHETVLGARPGR